MFGNITSGILYIMFYLNEGMEMYYDFDKYLKELYKNKDGQLLLYTKNKQSAIIEVENQNGYDAKFVGLPTESAIDVYYINGTIESNEVKEISVETHPEIFVKLGIQP